MTQDRKSHRRLAVYSSLIFILPTTLVGGYYLGYLVDQRLDSDPWGAVIGVFLGMIASFVQLFRLLSRY